MDPNRSKHHTKSKVKANSLTNIPFMHRDAAAQPRIRKKTTRKRSWTAGQQRDSMGDQILQNSIYMQMGRRGLDWRISMPFEYDQEHFEDFEYFFSFMLDDDRIFLQRRLAMQESNPINDIRLSFDLSPEFENDEIDEKIEIVAEDIDSEGIPRFICVLQSQLQVLEAGRVIWSYYIEDIDDIYVAETETGLYIETQGAKVYSIPLVDHYASDLVIFLVETLIGQSRDPNLEWDYSIQKEVFYIHTGIANITTNDYNLQEMTFVRLARGRLLIFESRESSVPLLCLPTAFITLSVEEKSTAIFIVIEDFGTFRASFETQQEVSLWLSAFDFEADLRGKEVFMSYTKRRSRGLSRIIDTLRQKSVSGPLPEIRRKISVREHLEKINVFSPKESELIEKSPRMSEDVFSLSSENKSETEDIAVEGFEARQLCYELQNAHGFFRFFYQHCRNHQYLIQSDVMTAEQYEKREKFSITRHIGIEKLRETLECYRNTVEMMKHFCDRSYLLFRSKTMDVSSNTIQFNYPGFESQNFSVGRTAVVNISKLLSNQVMSLSDDQWQTSLLQESTAAREIMQCTRDLTDMIMKGERKEALEISRFCVIDLLLCLFLAHFCSIHADEIAFDTRREVYAEDLLDEVGRNHKLNCSKLESDVEATFLINADVSEMYERIQDHPESVFCLRFICSPLNWISLLRFFVNDRLGKLLRIRSAVLALESSSKGLREFLNSLEREEQELESILSSFPTLSAMAESLANEKAGLGRSTYVSSFFCEDNLAVYSRSKPLSTIASVSGLSVETELELESDSDTEYGVASIPSEVIDMLYKFSSNRSDKASDIDDEEDNV